MIRFQKTMLLSFLLAGTVMVGCDKKDTPSDNFDTSGTYVQKDQMARPAINTVFVNSARKDEFNTTIPSAQGAAFNAQFTSVLTNFGYTTNVLGWDKATFSSALSTDVLNVSMTGATSFGTLTGRGLADDVITTELTLIFGGATGTSNPTLNDDHVNANDKPFLSTFPYLASPF